LTLYGSAAVSTIADPTPPGRGPRQALRGQVYEEAWRTVVGMGRSDESGELRHAARHLQDVARRIDSGEGGREDLDAILAAVVRAQLRLFGPRPKAPRGKGARTRILAYLQDHVGEEVHGEELAAISGIQEWARRVRELRVQEGWNITELGGSVYRLDSVEPDIERAAQWKLANAIRRRSGSAKSRIQAFLTATVGQVVSREQLDYVGKIKEGSRRVRELRDEDGWPINSHIDEAALRPGEYRLLSLDPDDRRDPAQRLYPETLRHQVFARDRFTCQACGRNREKALAAGDTRFYLEVHHRVALADELATLPLSERDDPANLVTLCHTDHLLETAKLQKEKRGRRQS
jgi:hypothetical protein